MNYTRAIFLINDACRAIECSYEPDGERHIFKTLNQDIVVDDLVAVETGTRHGFTIMKVEEVDLDVDMDGHKDLKWAISRFDTNPHEELKGQEERAIAAIKSAELRKKRADLRKAMFADHEATLKELQIADMGTNTPCLPDPQNNPKSVVKDDPA